MRISGIRVVLGMLMLVSVYSGGPNHTGVSHSCQERLRPTTQKQGKGHDMAIWLWVDSGMQTRLSASSQELPPFFPQNGALKVKSKYCLYSISITFIIFLALPLHSVEKIVTHPLALSRFWAQLK